MLAIVKHYLTCLVVLMKRAVDVEIIDFSDWKLVRNASF